MMPLAPERSTMCVPAKPKADFSIDFIVGNNNNKSSANNNVIGRSPSPPLVHRGSPSSPLSARQALPTHPYARPATASPPTTTSSLGSPTSPGLDEEEVRARLMGLQAAQAAGLPAGALHGLLPPLGAHQPHHGHQAHQAHQAHHPLAGPMCPPSATSPSGSSSPPHSPTHQPPLPQPFMLRGLYRPEPMMMPQHLHPQLQHHLMHPGAHPGALQGMPHHGHPGAHPHPHGLPGQPKDSYPLYPWLLSRHGRIFPHRFPGVGGPDFAGFLLHPFRKPKRIRTAFSPSQLLKLEHAFENNHYVVGAERKQVAQVLGLSETQVKVWFQNRRTKHKRTEQEEEAKRKSTSNNNNKDESSSSGSSSNNGSSQQASLWKDERNSHRPVDLSSHDSHDDSSDAESES